MAQSIEGVTAPPVNLNSGSFDDIDCKKQFGSACYFSGSSINATGAKICPQGYLDMVYVSAGNQFTCCCPAPVIITPVWP
jgi:hypothetical protein